MKKKIQLLTVIAAVLLLSQISMAQVRLGLFGGYASSTLDMEYETFGVLKSPEFSNLGGFTFGAILNGRINHTFSLQIEPRYIVKGVTMKQPAFYVHAVGHKESTLEANIELNLIELPIQLIAEFGNSSIRPFISGGVSLGYISKIEVEVTVNDNSMTNEVDDGYKELDITADIGAGVKFNLNHRTELFFSLRFSQGLIDLNDNEDDKGNPHVGKTKTQSLQFLAGILLEL